MDSNGQQAFEIRFRVMGANAHIWAVAPASDVVVEAVQELRRLHSLWSRFDADSEISRINRMYGSGGELVLHPSTIHLLQCMETAWWMTDGLCDPTILCSVLAGGYDRSLEDGTAAPNFDIPATELPAVGLSNLELDVANSSVKFPSGLCLDPGGIGKGVGADMASSLLIERGATAAMVNLGGDISFAGVPDGGSFPVVVADPFVQLQSKPLDHDDFIIDEAASPIAEFSVAGGGVATSTTTAKRGASQHRLIDPRTGERAETDLVSVTVAASSSWEAEAWATASMVSGSAAAVELLRNRDLVSVLVNNAGDVWAPHGGPSRQHESGTLL